MDCSVIISRYTFQDDILVVGGKESMAVDIREVEKNRLLLTALERRLEELEKAIFDQSG